MDEGAKRTLINQLARIHLERLRQPLDDINRGIARSSLKVANISPMNIGLMSELFLAPSLFNSVLAQICGEALTNIHVLN